MLRKYSLPDVIDSFSLLGDVDVMLSKLWYHKFAEKYDVRQEFIFAGENKVKFNPFEEIKPESVKWVKDYFGQIDQELKVVIVNTTEPNISKKRMQLSKEAMKDEMYCLVEDFGVHLRYICRSCRRYPPWYSCQGVRFLMVEGEVELVVLFPPLCILVNFNLFAIILMYAVF
jgi:hypothetical protein